MTAQVLDAGNVYWSQRRGRRVQVPVGYQAVICQSCQFEVHRPLRIGDGGRLAREHVRTAHWRELVAGTVTLGEDPKAWERRVWETLRSGVRLS